MLWDAFEPVRKLRIKCHSKKTKKKHKILLNTDETKNWETDVGALWDR